VLNLNCYYLLGTDEDHIEIPVYAKSINIEQDEIITYVGEDNDTHDAGQIGFALFSNPGGLEKAGDSVYLDTNNAGYIDIVAPETEGAATIVSGALEMSNVDLSEEFTE